MIGKARDIYFATRKKHDQLFNAYFMRPLAAGVVAVAARTPVTPNQLTLLNLAIFVVAAGLLVALPSYTGGLIAIGVLEVSYLFDCADGMLARHKKLASKEGHLFDFFTDELKAILLAGSLALRLYRSGGLGLDATAWAPSDARFLIAGIAAVFVIASAISLTNFVRRPELGGRETTVEAYYETAERKRTTSLVGRAAALVMMFLRFLNHYPSHIWIFALAGRFDIFFWMYGLLNLLYLAKGWLGLTLRFGRP
jgi:phosphatidylglycerophosphate synthase